MIPNSSSSTTVNSVRSQKQPHTHKNCKLLISGRHLLYSPSLAAKIGRSAATLLQQTYYWMSVPGGKTIDGVKWFWKTYQQWSEELQLSVSTIRRAVSDLKKLGLLAVDKLCAKTWYQANWYTVKIEALSAFIENEQINLLNLNTSICSKSANHIKEFSTEDFSTQQHAAADKDFVEENSETLPKDVTAIEETIEQTIEQTIETRSPSNVEQSTILRFVEEQNQSCSSTQPSTHEDTLSAPASEPVEKPPQEDVREICNQLRQIPCATAFRLNQEIIAVINKFWRNVPGAIAYLKEALRTWKRVNSPEAVFVAACKNGKKPENWGKPLPSYPQPSDEDLAQLAEAKSTKRIKDYYRQPDGLWVVDTGSECVHLCDFLSTTGF